MSPRSPAHVRQDGFVLMMVLGVMLMLSIIGLALLGLVSTTATATGSSIELGSALRDVDGALESAVQTWRDDASLVSLGTCGGKTTTYRDLTISCGDAAPFTPEQRIMNLTATRSGGVAGMARVRITDKVNGQPVLGYSIEVCDWLLGSDATSANLRGCS